MEWKQSGSLEKNWCLTEMMRVCQSQLHFGQALDQSLLSSGAVAGLLVANPPQKQLLVLSPVTVCPVGRLGLCQ